MPPPKPLADWRLTCLDFIENGPLSRVFVSSVAVIASSFIQSNAASEFVELNVDTTGLRLLTLVSDTVISATAIVEKTNVLIAIISFKSTIFFIIVNRILKGCGVVHVSNLAKIDVGSDCELSTLSIVKAVKYLTSAQIASNHTILYVQ